MCDRYDVNVLRVVIITISNGSQCDPWGYYIEFLTQPVVNIAVNKIDIWRVRKHLSRAHVNGLIVKSSSALQNQLWRHNQHVKRPCRCVKIVALIVICGFIMPCRKQNNVCTVVKNSWCVHSRVILLFNSLVAYRKGKSTPKYPASRECINRFPTAHTLSSLYCTYHQRLHSRTVVSLHKLIQKLCNMI